MPLSWTEIRQRSITFARAWSDAARERAEAQTFWNEFFDIFGIRRRTVASFEEPVRNLKGDTEFIDLFWKGKLIAEHKSRGKDLGKAHTQAIGYVQHLKNNSRDEEIPRYLLVSDFARFALHDLEADRPEDQTIEFELRDLPTVIRHFAFIAGYETRRVDPEDPANLNATRLLANLHDRLEDVGYKGHDLQRFMVRILFCLFAEDTGIFEPECFRLFILNHTAVDGSDLGTQLSHLFRILDTPADQRATNLDDDLAAFPYVNGELYRERLDFPVFDSAMRIALLSCAGFHWEKISPAVFGSLFQGVMEARERRQIGAHYTSERDILKLIRSLFLDDQRTEFETIKTSRPRLKDFHRKLGELKFLDPACGCGNFLVLSYRELRRLEMDVLEARFGKNLTEADIRGEARLHIGQFYGIEIEEWPVRIAEVALWLMDHQMNQELFHRFGGIRATIPLRTSPHIRHANALRIDWNEVLPVDDHCYVLGNPPFVGKQFMTAAQKQDMKETFAAVKGAGVLDYVAAWYVSAARYIRPAPGARVAFVSTNSITQGEQVGILWTELFSKCAVKIHFGHRTFAWESEARGKAHVHVVIVGFGHADVVGRRIYDYESEADQAGISIVGNISPYLIAGGDLVILSRSKPLCEVPEIVFGNMPNDGGHLLLSSAEKDELVAREPKAEKFIRPLLGSQEFINGESRWCLWLIDANPAELRAMPAIKERLDAVREVRKQSTRETTRALAAFPSLFGEIRQPSSRYLLIPSVSSESRRYVPMGFMDPNVIATNLALMIPNATLHHFGILSSAMHMAWVRQVCGRLESRYRYSNRLVYNNYPWPTNATDPQIARIRERAQGVLDARSKFPDSTLADLYDPLTMPPELTKAHAALDRAVDACYRSQPFTSERQRVEYLFGLYGNLVAPLTAAKSRGRVKKTDRGD